MDSLNDTKIKTQQQKLSKSTKSVAFFGSFRFRLQMYQD